MTKCFALNCFPKNICSEIKVWQSHILTELKVWSLRRMKSWMHSLFEHGGWGGSDSSTASVLKWFCFAASRSCQEIFICAQTSGSIEKLHPPEPNKGSQSNFSLVYGGWGLFIITVTSLLTFTFTFTFNFTVYFHFPLSLSTVIFTFPLVYGGCGAVREQVVYHHCHFTFKF